MAEDPLRSVEANQGYSQLLGFAYTAIGGYLDAVGYAELSGLYVSFMSGNTTRLGTSLANGDLAIVEHAFLVIGLFVGGAAVGGFVNSVSRSLLILPVIELILLITCIPLHLVGYPAFIYILPTAMGLQNAAVAQHGTLTVGKTFVTGSLVNVGQGIGKKIAGRTPDNLYQDGLSWLMFIIGVFTGALCWRLLGITTAITIAVVIVAMVVLLVRLGEQRGWFERPDSDQ